MWANKKNILYSILLAGLLLPFVFITDFFPFMRFGMFAEPFKEDIQTEKFELIKLTQEGQEKKFSPEEIGINPNTFHYLIRNYYHRNELSDFSDKLFKASASKIEKIKVIRIVASLETKQNDTTTVGIFTYHEK